MLYHNYRLANHYARATTQVGLSSTNLGLSISGTIDMYVANTIIDGGRFATWHALPGNLWRIYKLELELPEMPGSEKSILRALEAHRPNQLSNLR